MKLIDANLQGCKYQNHYKPVLNNDIPIIQNKKQIGHFNFVEEKSQIKKEYVENNGKIMKIKIFDLWFVTNEPEQENEIKSF